MTNQDDIRHTVTSGTVEFAKPGVYSFFCERHPAMRGEVHVN